MSSQLDPELVEALEAFAELTGEGLNLYDIPATRVVHSEMFKASVSELEPIADVTCEIRSVPGPGDVPDVPVWVYRPSDAPEMLPALLWIHGGGYVLGGAEEDDFAEKYFSVTARCVVVSVDYRLAPEHPFPAPIEDCYTALKWLATNCDELRVDSSRIAIGGASSGGGLAAELALLARDRGEVDIMFQMLIYPMIDDRNVVPAGEGVLDTFVWTRESNRLGWMSYLGSLYGREDVPHHAAVFRATDLSGLPPVHIPIGALDLFLNENMEYAKRLMEAGVPTELHVYPGGYHGFDGFAPNADVSRRFGQDRDSALMRAFGR
ncbi:MAG: alpha/beta hydrolase [Acidimicrobiia bacterium]|nr:alpha/beta hydrolase [Acidimicrobiia bacterium]